MKINETISRPAFDNPNDRYRLFLLEHLDSPNCRHRRELRKLSLLYDNGGYENRLSKELSLHGFIETQTNSETTTYHTTPKGIAALRYNRFPSETQKQTKEHIRDIILYITAVSSLIAAITGIFSSCT